MKKQELFNNVTEGSPYQRQPKQMGLYNAAYEHDACGVGMLVNIHGEKSHDIVESALKVLENMRHRGAEGADNKTGDGAGIMLQIPHEFILLQGIPVPEKGRYGTGLLFLPKNEKDQAAILSIIIEEIDKNELEQKFRKRIQIKVSNLEECTKYLEEKEYSYKVTSDNTIEIYEKLNVSDFFIELSKRNCTVSDYQEKEESLENYYLNLIGGANND